MAGQAQRTQTATLGGDEVLASMDHAVLSLDRGGVVQYANSAAGRLLRRPCRDLLGGTFSTHVEIDHRPAVHAALKRAAAGYPVRRLECQVGAFGASRWIDMDASPAQEGCVVMARELCHRHTLRAHVPGRHGRMQATLASVLDTIPVGIVIADGHGTPRLANRVARELLGGHALTPLQQWYTTGVLRHADGSPATAQDLPPAQTLADGVARRDVELHVLRPWGEATPILFNTEAVHDGEGRVIEVCCTLTNIHERRRIERQLQQAQKMEMVGTLAGGIAHDFNNILCAITGYSELALQQAQIDERGRDLVGEIKKAGDRAATLTRRLLSFSRKDALAPRSMQLNAAVRDMEPILRRLIGHEVALTLELAEGIAHIQADPGQIDQVLLNLVVNARDAMPDGGPIAVRTESVTLPDPERRHRVSAPAGTYAVLTVRDEGAGMDSDTLAHVFEPFYTTKGRGEGTGLGLSTVYGIVKQSRGAIDVLSRPGAGSTFRVYLPFARAEVLPDRTTAQGVPRGERGGETVLVVEDEPLVRALLREILEESGYEIVEAGNGREAIERIERGVKRPDLLVTDVVMPRMGGSELVRRLRRDQADLKVLFVSGYPNDALVSSGVHGAAAFLPKPFDARTLTAKVRDLLDRKPA